MYIMDIPPLKYSLQERNRGENRRKNVQRSLDLFLIFPCGQREGQSPGSPSLQKTCSPWRSLILLDGLEPNCLSQVIQFSSVQSHSRVRLFATPWIAVHQALLSITNSQSSLKLMPIKSVMPSIHLIPCRPLLLLPPIPPSIRVFASESTLHMRWPKYWSFSFSISPSKEQPGLISLQSKGLSRVFSNTTVQKHQFFSPQLSSQSNSHIHTWSMEKP